MGIENPPNGCAWPVPPGAWGLVGCLGPGVRLVYPTTVLHVVCYASLWCVLCAAAYGSHHQLWPALK